LESAKSGKPWALWIALGCSVLALVWLVLVVRAVQNGESCPQFSYYPNQGNTVVYSELFAQQAEVNGSFDLNPTNPYLGCLALVALMGISVALFRVWGRQRAAFLVMLPAFPMLCYACFLSGGICFFQDHTVLTHLDTVETNDYVYQLTYASGMAGGMDVHFEDLLVYECDMTGDLCRLFRKRSTIYPEIKEPRRARFEINSDNQLIVVVRDETILTIDPDNIESTN
jgi:hypothetical protein